MPKKRQITHDGVTLSIGQWAKRLGMSSNTLQARIRRGWTMTETLSQTRTDPRAQGYTVHGRTHTIGGWAARLGMSKSTLLERLKARRKCPHCWPLDRVFASHDHHWVRRPDGQYRHVTTARLAEAAGCSVDALQACFAKRLLATRKDDSAKDRTDPTPFAHVMGETMIDLQKPHVIPTEAELPSALDDPHVRGHLREVSSETGIRYNTLSARWSKGDRGDHLRREPGSAPQARRQVQGKTYAEWAEEVARYEPGLTGRLLQNRTYRLRYEQRMTEPEALALALQRIREKAGAIGGKTYAEWAQEAARHDPSMTTGKLRTATQHFRNQGMSEKQALAAALRQSLAKATQATPATV